MSPRTTTVRLSPHERRAQLMAAARRVLARSGVDGFSLEEVGREAGVAPTLPRHYFGRSERLLVAAVLEAIDGVTAPLLDRTGERGVAERLRSYVAALAADPWAHAVWMHAGDAHPDIAVAIAERRRGLIERALGRSWAELADADRMRGVAWLGACDAVLAEWVAARTRDPDALLPHLIDVSRRFGLGIA